MNDAVREYLATIGRKGAAARNERLTEDERKESARHAALVRHGKRKKKGHKP